MGVRKSAKVAAMREGCFGIIAAKSALTPNFQKNVL
jgi:hypothetical protein